MRQGHSKYLRYATLAVLVLALGGFVWGATRFQSHKDQSSAQADACANVVCDSKVYITVNGISGASVGLFSSPYSFGTCNDSNSTGTSIKGIYPARPLYSNLLGTGGAANKIYCQGWQFGPGNPAGVRLFGYVAGYNVSFAQDGVNIVGLGGGLGTVDCSQSYGGLPNCFFNFDSGTANVRATYTLIPPSTPSLTISNPTTSSLDVSWTAATAAEGSYVTGYTLKRNGTTIHTGSGLSKKDTGLSCGQSYSYQLIVNQSNNATGAVATSQTTKSGSTSACPSSSAPSTPSTPSNPTTPAPSTPSSPSNPTSPTSPSSPTASVPRTVSSRPVSSGSSGGGAIVQTPDSTPPTTPGGFNAYSSAGDPGVNLGWQAATDNVGVAGYKLERSEDGGSTWLVIGKNIQTTFSVDADTKFNSTYKYRLSAFDAAGNTSGFAETEVKTGGFTANAGPQTSVSLTSDDSVVSVNIPAGALATDAVCSVEYDANLDEVPDVPDYVLAGGPYRVICKNENGVLITKFDNPVQLTVDITAIDNYDNLAYYQRNSDSGQWENITMVTRDSGSSTDSFELKDSVVFAIMGKPQSTPWWVTVLWIIGIIVMIALALYLSYRWYMRRQVQKQYDDYYRKSHGF